MWYCLIGNCSCVCLLYWYDFFLYNWSPFIKYSDNSSDTEWFLLIYSCSYRHLEFVQAMADQIEQMGVLLETHQKVSFALVAFLIGRNHEMLAVFIWFMWLISSCLLFGLLQNSNLRNCKINMLPKFDSALIWVANLREPRWTMLSFLSDPFILWMMLIK